jgi:hypothetical protein
MEYTLGRAMQYLGIERRFDLLSYAEAGILKGRKIKVCWRFTQEDLDEFAAKVLYPLIDRKLDARLQMAENQWHVEAHFNRSQAARACGIPVISLHYSIKVGHVPPPSHQIGFLLYYTEPELERLKAYYAMDWDGRREHPIGSCF